MIGTEKIKSIAEKAAEHFGVPSLSVSVIQNGEQTDVGIGCGKTTVFPIGELSKTFISYAVRAAGIDLDSPVSDRSPWFGLKDLEASGSATIRDILLQRTGLQEHKLSWFIQPQLSYADAAELVRYLDPASGFRERSFRQDMLFASLSRAAEDITGKRWNEFVRSEALDQIPAEATFFTQSELSEASGQDVAGLWYSAYGRLINGTGWMTDLLAGGGSMFSCTSDLARWAEYNRTAGLLQTVPIRDEDFFDFPLSAVGTGSAEAGDGWYRLDLRGSRIVCGIGESGGSAVFAGWMEDLPFAFAAAVGLDGSPCAQSVGFSLCDLAAGREEADWNCIFRDVREAVNDAKRKNNSMMLRACTDDLFYRWSAGAFFNRGYGELRFKEVYGRLFLELFGVPMRIYHTSDEICILDATEVLGRTIPCRVDTEYVGILLEPRSGKMTEFERTERVD